jgi:TonB-dependent receptor
MFTPMTSQLLRTAALAALLSSPTVALAQGDAGRVTGLVLDAATKAPLAGADVILDGTSFITATDRTGTFRFAGVPAGDYTVIVSYLGHGDERAAVTVTSNSDVRIEVSLAATRFSETVQVRGDGIGDGQASALNQQRTALNITNVVSADQIGSFPDPNAAEAASRIPGVSITRDQGEGRYVLVRGTEARLNAMTINGERIPAPEGDLRQVALDAVPADQLQAIEVSKALTPDMDADAIGGAVNLVTRQAVNRPTLLGSVAGGYNGLQRSAEQWRANATAGRRFSNGRFGLLVGGTGSSLDRGSENFEAEYDGGALADFQLRDYVIVRERYGVNLSADTRLSDAHSLTFRGLFNEFKDYEVNNRIRFRPPNSRIEHVLKNRTQNQHIRSVSGSSQHPFGAGLTLDTRLAWAESQEDQPNRVDTIFRQSGIRFSPNVTASSIDPENIQPNPSANNAASATLNAWQTEEFVTTDRDVTGAFNLRAPLRTSSSLAAFVKVGSKFRDKRKDRDFAAGSASPGATIPFAQLQDGGFDNSRFLEFFPAGYAPFPGINADASRSLFNSVRGARFELNREGDAASYDATERVAAGYAMAELFVGDKLMILPGVRYESTRVEYDGFDVRYDADGDYVASLPVSGSDTYGVFMPGLHVRYAMTPESSLRAAYTRTLARPNYYDLVPYQLVFQEDNEIQRGNSSLKPTTSHNLDLMAERYFRSVGMISGGVFYKRLADYIYPFRIRETNFGDVYEVTQPLNGDSATLWGMELAFQNQFRSLPAPLDGLGVYANYTWTDSSADFPGRAETSTLPGQSAHIGNVSVWYEKYGFSARSSWNFHGKYVDAVGEDAASDVFYDNRVQWDVSLGQRLTRNIQLYVDALNLTNTPLRYYIGTTDRPIQEEYYRWWTMFGVKVNF